MSKRAIKKSPYLSEMDNIRKHNKQLDEWNEKILNSIAYLINQYEAMNGTTINGNPLPKSKVKFDGLRKYCKFNNKNDVIGI